MNNNKNNNDRMSISTGCKLQSLLLPMSFLKETHADTIHDVRATGEGRFIMQLRT